MVGGGVATLKNRFAALSLFVLLGIVVIILDQVSKFYAVEMLSPQYPYQLTSFLNFILAYNRGAAFGFLNEGSGWQLVLFVSIALLVIAYVIFHIWVEAYRSLLVVVSYGFIAGGAIGNLIDRIRFGYVVDFIDVHYAGWHFWVFNLADSALTLGVILLFATVLTDVKKRDAAKTENGRID